MGPPQRFLKSDGTSWPSWLSAWTSWIGTSKPHCVSPLSTSNVSVKGDVDVVDCGCYAHHREGITRKTLFATVFVDIAPALQHKGQASAVGPDLRQGNPSRFEGQRPVRANVGRVFVDVKGAWTKSDMQVEIEQPSCPPDGSPRQTKVATLPSSGSLASS